tara:strand:+ start:1172 stop:2014 length:843 start_codon:yes stop_codon:yes gene_type:complete
MEYKEILHRGSKMLKLKNIKSFNLDSEILLSSSLKLKRSELLLNLDKKINSEEKNIFFSLIRRRMKFEPVAYIVGYKEFWKHKFKVDKNVLIPRPDTETLVEEVLKEIEVQSSIRILDIGTGSGCIILSILRERKNCYGVGIDISKKAINLAKYNAKIQQIKNRIKFFNSDIDNFCRGKYDSIISNPPYIKLFEIDELDEDIKNHEPIDALNGGVDGFSKIRLVIEKSSNLIRKNGKLFLEVGEDQTMRTLGLLKLNGFYINRVCKDLANKNRCIVSTKI